MNEYYVYCYLDPRKPGKYYYEGLDICFLYEPFYIGKGKGNRIFEHMSSYELNSPKRIKHNTLKNKIIKNIILSGIRPYIIKLYENVKNDCSNIIEISLIKSIGKKIEKNGPLVNISDGGKGGDNMKYLDPERKRKIYDNQSKRLKGKPYKGPEKGFRISQYSLEGEFIMEWRSITKASKGLGIHKYTIIQNLKGVGYKSAGGFIFKKEKLDKISPREKDTTSIIQLDINGNFIREWESMSEASNSLNLRISGISSCVTGRYKYSGGYKWKYKEEYDKERN